MRFSFDNRRSVGVSCGTKLVVNVSASSVSEIVCSAYCVTIDRVTSSVRSSADSAPSSAATKTVRELPGRIAEMFI